VYWEQLCAAVVIPAHAGMQKHFDARIPSANKIIRADLKGTSMPVFTGITKTA
jgi:formylmethanofuran dehydrogenase subunit D